MTSHRQPQDGVLINVASSDHESSDDEDDMWARPRLATPALPSGNTAGPHRLELPGPRPPSIHREQHAPDAEAVNARQPSNPVTRTNMVRGRSRPEVKHLQHALIDAVPNTVLHSPRLCEDNDDLWYRHNVLRNAGVHAFLKRRRITRHLQVHPARNLEKTLRHSIDLQS